MQTSNNYSLIFSLASFAGMNESKEKLPEDEEILLFSGLKDETEQHTKKRQALPDGDDEEENEMFPTTTSACKPQSIKRIKRRTSNVPPTFNMEKESKYDDSSDDDGDKHDANVEEESIECAQPFEEPLLNEITRKSTNKNVKKLHKDMLNKPCKHKKHHAKLALIGLKEEDNNKFLNKGCVMENLHCTKCGRTFVKNDKMKENKTDVTVFNAKRPALCCEELLTSGQFVCKFAICHDCKINLMNNDDNKTKGRSNRRTRQFN